ncbi:MAG TPA: RNA polymerase sigma-70 factor, partial [Pseudosphingobacterium sp.]|nr:RNA polymerase sigma-70 factor [Pseudosphingobacterium sp.]
YICAEMNSPHEHSSPADMHPIDWDITSFEKIYREHWHDLLHYCISYLDDEVLAEEIVQEIFISIWSRRNELQLLPTKLKGYLVRAVKLKIFDHFRSEAIKQKHKDYLCKQTCDPNPQDTDQIILYRELSGTLKLLVNELPCKCREVYLLHDKGLTLDEIASQLHISIHTVKYHLQHAKSVLRRELKIS